MKNTASSKYRNDIQSRSLGRFLLGLAPRFRTYIFNSFSAHIARQKGAQIGKRVTIPYQLAKRANRNLVIGDNSSIQTDLIDLRSPVTIGSNVIIGSGVEILTTSHHVDSPEWEHRHYGIVIEDYVWIATRSFILPSCQSIEYGAVCAAGSVVAKNISRLEIVAGNPAKKIRLRSGVHESLVVESLLGNDLIAYITNRRQSK